ncbi:hypothetical protein [Streptomyces zagrosensis]|uniref:Secreted protein n=1 Tax=Streptomyces zagrosensis TaxID=1042984 RepID=A0A7W9Q871_9ACTN|nr:hypothetical protein [Streptomyces zagrosensis]MBB5935301.1 hypothetical protein [Streptomyces zagrosensis]
MPASQVAVAVAVVVLPPCPQVVAACVAGWHALLVAELAREWCSSAVAGVGYRTVGGRSSVARLVGALLVLG